jgi:hypothetical protein
MEDDKSLVCKAKKMATERACKPHTRSSMSVRGGSGRHPLRIFSDSVGVVCKASRFQAQFALRDETNNDRFFATARRTAKKLGQAQKLSQRELRQFKLIPAFGPEIEREFEEQRLGGFHQIKPASFKLK